MGTIEPLENRLFLWADLDPAFGIGGMVFLPDATSNGAPETLVTQGDGKPIIAFDGPGQQRTIMRFNLDGTPDSSFGADGRVMLQAGAVHGVRIALEPDGKVLVATSRYSDASDYDIVLTRLDPAGNPDPSFGVDRTRSIVLDGSQWPKDLQVLPDFRIVVRGDHNGGTGYELLTLLLDPDGAFVESRMATAFYQSDGRRIERTGNGLARYNLDGSADLTFGVDGSVQLPSDFSVARISIEADDRIVLAGATSLAGPQSEKPTVLVLSADGVWEFTTEDVTPALASVSAQAGRVTNVQIDSQGRLVAAGLAYEVQGLTYTTHPMLLRFTPDGALDTTFAAMGMIRPDFAELTVDRIFSSPVADSLFAVAEIHDATAGWQTVLMKYAASGSTPDDAAPAGALDPRAITEYSTQSRILKVNWPFIDGTTIDPADLLITGPDGSSFQPTGAGTVQNTGLAVASYTLSPPGGAWDGADSGTWQVFIQSTQVRGENGHYARSGLLGTFQVSIPATGTISGSIIVDADADGYVSTSESGMPGRPIFLDADANGRLDPGELSTTTDSSGRYTLNGVPPGTHRLAVGVPSGWRISSPGLGYRSITLAGGQSIANQDFLLATLPRIRVRDGILSITATGNADRITITPDTAAFRININRSITTVPMRGVRKIVILGGPGSDTILLDRRIALPARLEGGAGSDNLRGGSGADSLFGGDGDDILDGGAGGDLLRGNTGSDLADYSSRRSGIRATLNGKADDGASGEADNVSSDVENITGGAGDDVLAGNLLGNTLRGGGGNDQLFGEAGDDLLEGQAGDDRLDGGYGNDVFVGGDGNDYFDAHDGLENERVNGGPGSDRAIADEVRKGSFLFVWLYYDKVVDVESVDYY